MLSNSYRVWPFVNLFTFTVIAAPFRPLTNSVVAIAWNAYLSYLNQNALKPNLGDHLIQQQVQEQQPKVLV